MANKTLSERIAECKQNIIDARLDPQHDLEFQIIEELLEELENRKKKVYQLFSLENRKKKADKLETENKSWQEMVDSVNQTNQALIKRLQENKNEK